MLAKAYDPTEFEAAITRRWHESNAFHAEPTDDGEPYCVLIPPPNVTAALHLGHAFNNTLQDVLVRYHRMKGFKTLWMPGTDHAGIATQTVVEKRLLQEEGKKRTDYSRDDFIAKVQSWKDEYEATITEQLKVMGCSCDFQRQRFTMDDMCARAVREAFFRLFKDGLIYRGKRLVNWDPVSQTALADDEVEMEEVNGHFWYLRYPLVHPSENPDDPFDCQEVTWVELVARGYPGAEQHPEDEHAWVTVATTRPETYLGDTAVAINPADERAVPLRGLCAQLPLVGRVIPIVEDDYVVRPDANSSDPKAKFATGFLKVTPAHDPNDWEIGQRHDLGVINVMAPDASISDSHGWEDVGDAHLFVGMSREAAREKVVSEFKARCLLEDVKDHVHSVGHSYRSHVPIEPYLSDQWYVKVTDDKLVGEAQRALTEENGLSFHPERYAKTYSHWHENLRDWCISRQLWWGHRIPVWSKEIESSSKPMDSYPWASRGDVAWREENERQFVCIQSDDSNELIQLIESAGFTQDPDVLDTWFSSGLWPISTMGWPESNNLLDTFNPTSVLCTAREIITLWVSRMVMFNRYFLEDRRVPFKDVYIHAMIQDGHGQKMSKSLGNGVDPRDIIHSHGADAMRFVLTQMATATQDVRLPVDIECPHCHEVFGAKTFENSADYRVAEATQKCPKCKKSMVSGYGNASGEATPTESQPLARNASSKFDLGRAFCNKLWNATRFALSHLNEDHRWDACATDIYATEGRANSLALPDAWIITRVHRAIERIETALTEYQFNHYSEAIYDLARRDFCDWYLEAIKPTVRDSPQQQRTLQLVLDTILRLLHPIAPFITEELWPHIMPRDEHELLATADWPLRENFPAHDAEHDEFERARSLVEAIRTIRGEQKVPDKKSITLHANNSVQQLLKQSGQMVPTLAAIEATHPLSDDKPANAITFTFEGQENALSGLTEEVDAVTQATRLEEEIAELKKQIAQREGRLANPGYANKAPAHLVQQTRDELERFQNELAAKTESLHALTS